MSCIVKYTANVYDEEQVWRVVEKNAQLMHYLWTYFETGRLSNREEIPIVMNKTVRCCYIIKKHSSLESWRRNNRILGISILKKKEGK